MWTKERFSIEMGFDPVYGARPLKRAIQRLVLDPLAMEILAGKVHEGHHVLADTDEAAGGTLRFTTQVSQAA